jgi:hypothetical protein
MSRIAGTDAVIMISERGGAGGVAVAVADVRASWEDSRAGSLTCALPARDLIRAGAPVPFVSSWVNYTHPSAGRWGGVITATDTTDGVTEIVAESYHVLLRGRLSARRQRTAMASAGALFIRALSDAGRADPLWVTIGDVDEDGPLVRVEWRGADLYESVIPGLAGEVGYAWDVTADRVARFVARLGEDRRPWVLLAEPRHIVNSRYAVDLWSVRNSIVGVGGGSTYDRATYFQAEDVASVRTYGRIEGERQYPTLSDKTTIETRVRRDLLQTSAPTPAMELTLVDTDHCFAWFREGDTVSVELGSAGVRDSLRVTSRALDTVAGTLTISGSAEAV